MDRHAGMLLRSVGISVLVLGHLAGCGPKPDEAALFQSVPATESGLTFDNRIQPFESEKLNANTYDPMYNGAGVGIGDFDRDGRQDVFFAGNMVSSRLYLNRTPAATASAESPLRFEDVTRQAGLTTHVWCTGVSVADVNADGWPDIYVCVAGPDTIGADRTNRLFINQGAVPGGVPTFREMARAYGLADSGMNTQAAFFDYDHDGDLDCYLLNNAVERTGRNTIRPKRLNGEGPSTDRLYRNESPPSPKRSATNASATLPLGDGGLIFRDVSREAGILAEGYGLGLTVADLNRDGWLDIYCANDFLSNDVVYINNQDGTFTDRAAAYLNHTSFNSMGVDIQDVNNDNWPDVMVVDMLPETSERQKMMLIKTNWEFFHLARQQGYQDQYVRNTLQLNMTGGRAGENGPFFSEIGQLAGVSRTDWSWAPLLQDFDNDGYKDLIVSNGYRRDITNLDYVVYLNQQIAGAGLATSHRQTLDALYKLPEIKRHNYAFRNQSGDTKSPVPTFADVSEAWGLGEPTFSNGAAYADLDNDGDLDLVFNNIDSPAGLYRNQTIRAGKPITRHYLRLKLPADAHGLGAEVQLTFPDGTTQTVLAHPVRGYTSSVEPFVHVGMGTHSSATVRVRWADGSVQALGSLAVDQVHLVDYQPTASREQPETPVPTYFKMQDAALTGLTYRHQESVVTDFQYTPTLPQTYARNGPAIAIADADGNGLDDVFVGADAGQTRVLYLQQTPGRFVGRVQGTTNLTDMGALFFDADQDGDADLYVVSGGSQYADGSAAYQDRLYLNDGTGQLTRSEGIVPVTRSSGSCVVAVDFDHDGDLDLFRGGRVKVGSYPLLPDNYLLRNDNGHFADVTDQLAPGLRKAGMICSALWTDCDNDGWPDLMLAGEFMPIRLFRNRAGAFRETPTQLPPGLWNSLTGADFDGDGDIDYLAGNVGLNTRYRASAQEPMRIYGKDFDGNGRIDPLLTYFWQGTEQLSAIRDALNDQMTTLSRKRFASYQAYADQTFHEAFSADDLAGATVWEAHQLQSIYIENTGRNPSGRPVFAARPLPLLAQISPVFGVQTGDFNADGLPDALLVGNSHASETYSGWYDAGRGTLLLGDGKGHFNAVPAAETGLNLSGDAKAVAALRTGQSVCYLVSNNNGPLQWLTPRHSQRRMDRPLDPTENYRLLRRPDGRTERVEYYNGSGYLAQSSR